MDILKEPNSLKVKKLGNTMYFFRSQIALNKMTEATAF